MRNGLQSLGKVVDRTGGIAKIVAMALSQGAIEGIKKGDIANEPVTLKVSALQQH